MRREKKKDHGAAGRSRPLSLETNRISNSVGSRHPLSRNNNDDARPESRGRVARARVGAATTATRTGSASASEPTSRSQRSGWCVFVFATMATATTKRDDDDDDAMTTTKRNDDMTTHNDEERNDEAQRRHRSAVTRRRNPPPTPTEKRRNSRDAQRQRHQTKSNMRVSARGRAWSRVNDSRSGRRARRRRRAGCFARTLRFFFDSSSIIITEGAGALPSSSRFSFLVPSPLRRSFFSLPRREGTRRSGPCARSSAGSQS